MTLSRRSSRIYLDDLDVMGLINVLRRRASECGPDESVKWALYYGAERTLLILCSHDFIDSQKDFIEEFDKIMQRKEQHEE